MQATHLHHLAIPIRWVDLDAYGHVNNAKYFDYMTEARAVLLGKYLAKDFPYQWVLVDTQCSFKKPCGYPETLILEQHIANIGNSSFALRYRFFSQNDLQICYAEGTATMVCFDPKKSKAVRIPDTLRTLLQQIHASIS